MSLHLPARSVIIPELDTVAYDATDGEAKQVTGEPDFYIKDRRWSIELLKEGKGIGEHLGRFKAETGKYRKVPTDEYYVIDCRGTREGNGARLLDHRCTLYFSKDFKRCRCEMKGYTSVTLTLQA